MSEIRFVAIELHLRRLDTALEELQLRLRKLEPKVSHSQTSEVPMKSPLTGTAQGLPAFVDPMLRFSKIPPLYSGD